MVARTTALLDRMSSARATSVERREDGPGARGAALCAWNGSLSVVEFFTVLFSITTQSILMEVGTDEKDESSEDW